MSRTVSRPRTRSRSAARAVDDDTLLVLDALRAVARALRVAERDVEQRLGVHPAQLTVLRLLAERRAPSLADLAERSHTDPSSASVAVQPLVERGLVARTPCADDRRRTQLEITSAGRALLRRAPASVHQRLAGALAALAPHEVEGLRVALPALAGALNGGTVAEA